MRVLVAGATSSLGISLLNELVDAGHEPVTSPVSAAHRSSYLASLEGVTADAVINLLGASTRLAPGTRALVAVNRARAEGTSTMLAAAERVGAARIVGASSYTGYGLSNHGDVAIDESAPFAVGDDAESASLRSAEQQALSRGGLVLRFGQLWSQNAATVPPVSRRGDGQLPVVHVRDAARAAVLALERGAAGSVYNITSDETVTWRQLQQAQARMDGFAAPVALDPALLRLIAPLAARVICDTSMRLSTVVADFELGWSARIALSEISAGEIAPASVVEPTAA
jgi:nucleoside-diphosphate-sugar epimerase